MKTVKSILATAILGLAVSLPVYAGDVHTPGAPLPQPPPPPTEPATIAPGEIGSPGAAAGTEDLELSELALDILWAALSLF